MYRVPVEDLLRDTRRPVAILIIARGTAAGSVSACSPSISFFFGSGGPTPVAQSTPLRSELLDAGLSGSCALEAAAGWAARGCSGGARTLGLAGGRGRVPRWPGAGRHVRGDDVSIFDGNDAVCRTPAPAPFAEHARVALPTRVSPPPEAEVLNLRSRELPAPLVLVGALRIGRDVVEAAQYVRSTVSAVC